MAVAAHGGDKRALRERMLLERAALPAQGRAAAAEAIAGRLAGLPELAAATAILGYAAFGAEVDLGPFLTGCLAEDRAVYLPWVDGEDLRIARVHDLAGDVGPGWRGVREPIPGVRREEDVAVLDAVVAPGIAFDRRGNRLGYGGGHFDRMLARLRPSTFVVGVAYDAQLVDAVPVEAHDAPVDAVVTESRTLRTGR
jgi:5-formyltetrahydrofolate cyclo-ligase